MQISKTSVRERLIGKALVGFDTRAALVRAPTAKVGTGESGPPPPPPPAPIS